ncbi:hypothetical protein ACFQ1S_03130 [Kibdelosporangium lantanae]|uniref:Uncharacterized protein n=1 Tax=Kibdelosporangium lantanae TaxID=1497396 RepID=A0ABW3M1U9_9PSEU
MIDLIATHLANSALEGREEAENGTFSRLYTLVAERLKQTPLGAAVMDALKDLPSDVTNQEHAVTALTAEIGKDSNFGLDLELATQEAEAQVGGGANQGKVSVNTQGGNLKLRDSAIAAGNVKITKSTKIGLGAFVAVAILAVAFLIGRGTGSSNPVPPPDPVTSLAGEWERIDGTGGELGVMEIYRDGTANANLELDGSWEPCAGKIFPVEDGTFRFEAQAFGRPFTFIVHLQKDETLAFGFDFGGNTGETLTKWRKLKPGETPTTSRSATSQLPPPIPDLEPEQRECRIVAIVDTVTVTEEPDSHSKVIMTIERDGQIGASKVVRNGFRSLGLYGWVPDNAVKPLPGRDC